LLKNEWNFIEGAPTISEQIDTSSPHLKRTLWRRYNRQGRKNCWKRAGDNNCDLSESFLPIRAGWQLRF